MSTSRTRIRLVLVATAVLVLAGALALKPSALAQGPRTPADGAEVLERLPPRGPAVRERDALRVALASNRGDARTAARLARLDVEASRERGDPRYLGQAQAALAPWWDAPSPPEEILVLKATIRQSLHDFDGALADLDRVVEEAPGDAQAWVTRSVVLSVQGRYADARASCRPVQSLTSAIVGAVCDAAVDGLTGDASAAFDRVQRALATPATRELREWALTTLADLAARLARDEESALLFRQALALDPSDGYALAAYADLMLDDGQAGEVCRLLAGRTDNDNLLLRLVLAESATGDPSAAAHVDLLAARYEAGRLRGEALHRREEARFDLAVKRDARAALALARANWDVQREPWDMRVLLAAALEVGDRAAADPALALLAASHLEDPHVRALAERVRAMP